MVGCNSFLEIEIPACPDAMEIGSFEPNQPVFLIFRGLNHGYSVSKIADSAGRVTVNSDELPPGFFNQHRRLTLQVQKQDGEYLSFLADDDEYDGLLLIPTKLKGDVLPVKVIFPWGN